jgi:hypothetical protein
VIVRVVVLPGAMVYLATRVAALDLDRRVPDGESVAQPLLQVSHDMLGLTERAVVDHHVNAESHIVRGQCPDV